MRAVTALTYAHIYVYLILFDSEFWAPYFGVVRHWGYLAHY
jgi:hypothetical protein